PAFHPALHAGLYCDALPGLNTVLALPPLTPDPRVRYTTPRRSAARSGRPISTEGDTMRVCSAVIGLAVLAAVFGWQEDAAAGKQKKKRVAETDAKQAGPDFFVQG